MWICIHAFVIVISTCSSHHVINLFKLGWLTQDINCIIIICHRDFCCYKKQDKLPWYFVEVVSDVANFSVMIPDSADVAGM